MTAGAAFYIIARDPMTYRFIERRVSPAMVGLEATEVLARYIELAAVSIGTAWGRHYAVPFPLHRIEWTGEARSPDPVRKQAGL